MVGILVTALVAMVITMAQHWFPWKELLKQDLPRPAAYALGTLAILAPVTVLLAIDVGLDRGLAIMALWASALGAGAGTLLGYGTDSLLHARGRVLAAERESQLLRPDVEEENGQEVER